MRGCALVLLASLASGAALAFASCSRADTRPVASPPVDKQGEQDKEEDGEEDEEGPRPRPRGAPSQAHSPSGPAACAPDLARCPPDGCAAPGSPHALLNRLKRRATLDNGGAISFETATPITFEHLRRLQAEANRVLPKRAEPELDEADRRLLARLDAGGLALGEGTAVRLAGYIAPPGRSRFAGPHEGSAESANCRVRTAPAWRALDFHIPITAARGEDECHGAVVEMIPQGRDAHPSWTLPALRELGKRGTLLLFVGRLFYDSEHKVRPDCRAPHVAQPKRMSLWEVHPVLEMYACSIDGDPAREDGCVAGARDGWRRVD